MTLHDEAVATVMQALVDIWPDPMLSVTGSGLQFGQLVAEAAVTALDVDRLSAVELICSWLEDAAEEWNDAEQFADLIRREFCSERALHS